MPARRYYGRVITIELHPFVDSEALDTYLASEEANVLMTRISRGFSIVSGFSPLPGACRVWGQLDHDATLAADLLRTALQVRQLTDDVKPQDMWYEDESEI